MRTKAAIGSLRRTDDSGADIVDAFDRLELMGTARRWRPFTARAPKSM